MANKIRTVIKATGKYIPPLIVPNSYFLKTTFYDQHGEPHKSRDGRVKSTETIIQDFERATGIKKRRYVQTDIVTSEAGYYAAKDCLVSVRSGGEDLDHIFFAHNFGDIDEYDRRSDMVPNLATRLKQKLGITNRKTECSDIVFGCAGFSKGIIDAHRFFRAGDGKKILNIGAEVLSRVSDFTDRDSMIYSDGAGAVLLEAVESERRVGVLSYAVDCGGSSSSYLMRMNGSEKGLVFKMHTGRDVQRHALRYVPRVMQEAIDKAGLSIRDISKFILHQTNEKMIDGIVRNLFGLYGIKISDQDIQRLTPKTISWLGNNGVATQAIVLDLMLKEELKGHSVQSGDNMVFGSVGAGGPNINSLVYRMP